jgi:hypothetical protein
MNLHDYLMRLHSNSGLTGRDVANRVGVSEVTFCRWRCGYMGMRLEHAEQLYKVYTGEELLDTLLK